MQFSDTTPTSDIIIQGATFSAPEPFEEGHPLTANEAAALNQLLHENLRNNFAKTVAKALDEVHNAVDSLDMEDLQAKFTEYAASYEFGVRKAATHSAVDPVEREAYKQAAKLVRAALKKNLKISQKDLEVQQPGKFDELVEALAKKQDVIDAARKIVEATQGVSGVSLEGLE